MREANCELFDSLLRPRAGRWWPGPDRALSCMCESNNKGVCPLMPKYSCYTPPEPTHDLMFIRLALCNTSNPIIFCLPGSRLDTIDL